MLRQYTLFIFALMSIAAFADIKPRFMPGTPIEVQKAKMSKYLAAEKNKPASTANGIGSQQKAPLKSLGSPKIPVVLVQFADLKFVSACSDDIDNPDSVRYYFDKHFNGTPYDTLYRGTGNWGSVRDYYRDQSNGMFTPDFVMMGPITLDDDYAYYGADHSGERDYNIGAYYRELTIKAQEWASEHGISWSQFDNNGDGSVDVLYDVFAGCGQNGDGDDNTIWPKNSYGPYTVNGIKYQDYVSSNELYNGKCEGIGVICHEFSHSLGLPDFYDTYYEAYGLDYWDIMDSGCYCNNGYRPCGYSAYEKEFMGWLDLQTLTPDSAQTITVSPMTRTDGVGYKLVNPNTPNEYFIIENRQAEGWDTNIGRGLKRLGYISGLLITHVHYVDRLWELNAVNTDPSHQHITIVPADGSLDSYMLLESGNKELELSLFNSAAGDVYPGLQNVTSFAGNKQALFVQPGEYLNQPVTGITQNADGTITFQFCAAPQHIPGDANNDATVDVSDISAIAAYILGGTTDTFDMIAADFDADGEITVVDISQIASYILGGN